MPHLSPPSVTSSPPHNDLHWVAVATMLTWLLSAAFDLHEKLSAFTARFELWQADELPLALTTLGLGLAWYAWRRWAEIAQLLLRNRELAQQLITVQERERLVLSRELHDELAQHCTAIRIEASYLRRSQDGESVRAAAQRASDSAEHLLDGLRGILRKLRPAELDELGLAAALQSLASSCEARGGLRCGLQIDGSLNDLGANVDVAVYRVAQEALSNVLRHASAQHAILRIERRKGTLALQVEDDGCGFDVQTHTRGLGLLGATERAAALGGHLVARSVSGEGTAIRMTLPLAHGARGRR
jgi:signal transduction histidine kinase